MIDVLRAPKKVLVRKFRSLANPAVQLSRAAKKKRKRRDDTILLLLLVGKEMTDSHSPWTSSSPSFFYAELEDVLPNTIFVAFAAAAAAPLVATPTEAHRVRSGGSRKDPLDSSLDFGKEGGEDASAAAATEVHLSSLPLLLFLSTFGRLEKPSKTPPLLPSSETSRIKKTYKRCHVVTQ